MPTGSYKTYSNQVYILFQKGSLASSFSSTWTTEAVECCSKIKLENHGQRNGDYEWSSADNAYKITYTSNGQSVTDFLMQSSNTAGGPGWAVGKDNSFGVYTTVSIAV